MASFDCHSFCARCRDKGKDKDPCVEKPDTTECKFCNVLILEQRIQLATPSYKIKKEKREAKQLEALSTPVKDNSALVDPSTVSVIGAVDDQGTLQSPLMLSLQKRNLRKTRLPLLKSWALISP